MGGEDMDFQNSSPKTNLLLEATKEELLTAPFRETEFDYQDAPYKYSVSGYFDPSRVRCKKLNEMFSNQVFF